MPTIDTSTYPTQKQQPSFLETLGGAANLQGTLNQNKLFQQQFQTNKAISDIYKQAINPDGTIDQAKLSTLMQNNPNASYGLPQAYQQSQEAQKRNIDIDVAKVQQAQAHLTATAGYLAPLIKPGSSSADVASALAHASTNGLINTDMAGKIWSSLPRGKNGQIDESQIPAWAQQQQIQVLDAQQRLNAMHPAPTMQQLPGGGQAPFVMPQIGQVQQVGPTIQAAPPPTTTVVGPDGTPRYVGAPQGNNPYEPGAQGASPQAGGMPGGGQGMGAHQGGGIAGMPAGMSPAAQAASTETGGFSAKQGTVLQGRADRVADNKAVLGNLEGELGDFTSGPGTESIAKFAKFVNANVPGANFNPKGFASREQFNKLAGMLAQSQFQALGGTGTDAKLDATTLTSPNSELSKLGNKGIIAMLKGNEDAIAAKNQAWQSFKQQNGPQSYGQFSVQFNKSYDPRVFQSQYLTPDDRKKMLSGMTKQEQKGFLNSYRTALSNGWVQLPGAQ